MGILSSLIGIGGSLLGGLFGSKKEEKAINRQNEYNDPINVRARAEEAGFNPLLFIGPGVGQQTATGGTNYMGAAIADSSMMLANQISGQAEEKARLQNLQLQNQKLQKELQQATLRPKSAGLYGPVALGINAGVQSMTSPARAGAAAATSSEEDDDKAKASSDEAYKPGTKTGTFYGWGLRRSGLFSDADWFTGAYGEPAEWMVAPLSLAADIGYTIGSEVEERVKKGLGYGKGPIMSVGGQRFQMESGKQREDKKRLQAHRARQDKRNPLKNLGF